jgi:hypothetical protein
MGVWTSGRLVGQVASRYVNIPPSDNEDYKINAMQLSN